MVEKWAFGWMQNGKELFSFLLPVELLLSDVSDILPSKLSKSSQVVQWKGQPGWTIDNNNCFLSLA